MSDYLAIHGYRLQKLHQLISTLNLNKNSKILDLGCYPDYLLKSLRKEFTHVYGVSSVREKISDPKVKVLNLESDRLDYPADTFDLVILSEVLEHLGTGVEKLFSDISRILKPGAYFILTTPNAIRLHNLFALILGKNIYFPLFQLEQHHNFRHQREYTLVEILSLTPPSLKSTQFQYLAAYPPFRDKVKSEAFFTRLGKWFFYGLLLLFPRRRDTLVLVFKKS